MDNKTPTRRLIENSGNFRTKLLDNLSTIVQKRFHSNLTELQKRGLKEVRELIREERMKLSMFMDRLSNATPNNVYVMESFDITALYTNVSNECALQATHELLIEHQGTVNMNGL
ncbi:hypothetical protein KIN20_017004 [Parelaphostrongylus tenuis]|nr:hypothetical protein KIN20_017004 [Parelaphostrongylus tenuis]